MQQQLLLLSKRTWEPPATSKLEAAHWKSEKFFFFRHHIHAFLEMMQSNLALEVLWSLSSLSRGWGDLERQGSILAFFFVLDLLTFKQVSSSRKLMKSRLLPNPCSIPPSQFIERMAEKLFPSSPSYFQMPFYQPFHHQGHPLLHLVP